MKVFLMMVKDLLQFKYLLSNLYDYDNTYVAVNLCDKDNKALLELNKFSVKLKDSYEKYDFRNLFNLTTSYVSTNSKSYFDLETKELLYEGDPYRKERKDRQFVMNTMLNTLVRILAPMVPYLCEDVYSFMDKDEVSVFMLEL